MELKEQLKQELLNKKEEKRKKEIEENKKLKKLTLYTIPNNPLCENYKKFFNENGIKFDEKDITLYPEVSSTTMSRQVPTVHVNGEYLVQGRELKSPQSSLGIIKFFASPDYIVPSFEQRMVEMMKNMTLTIQNMSQTLSRQIQPMNKILNDLMKEEEEELKENEKKNN